MTMNVEGKGGTREVLVLQRGGKVQLVISEEGLIGEDLAELNLTTEEATDLAVKLLLRVQRAERRST